ncbi:hypothetical protein RFI_32228 [Reticulomyxa filosa]|uniref:Uncharacterized protein n=1 Tax=Reticulomyxa filosa TaxID=46433 RepID=X6LU41_RETFI|nr:hypothetical protein RFI_32228 [Reticulomyxa filosa]|eukprot:ETO05169.1 hypothetical protein RFI_32228 [Reticulomyxa filosa]
MIFLTKYKLKTGLKRKFYSAVSKSIQKQYQAQARSTKDEKKLLLLGTGREEGGILYEVVWAYLKCVISQSTTTTTKSNIKNEWKGKGYGTKNTGASGKSTIFKNLRKWNEDTICDPKSVMETAESIRSNIVQYMAKMLLKSQEMYERDMEANKGCQLPDDSKVIEHARVVLSYAQPNGGDVTENKGIDFVEVGKSISFLWKISAIQETFKRRGLAFSFPDNLEYFYDKSEVVMSPEYVPTDEDIIKARVRTTGVFVQKDLFFFDLFKKKNRLDWFIYKYKSGVVNYSYTNKDGTFHITDVGGQRSERKKWIHQFEDVAAVIFLMALNHYNAVLYEDEQKNAMHEAVDLFVELANSKFLRNSGLDFLFVCLFKKEKMLAKNSHNINQNIHAMTQN